MDFHDYYMSSILTQTKEWFQPAPTSTGWGGIEASTSPGSSLSSWLFSISLGVKIPPGISPTIVATLKTWNRFVNVSVNHTPNSEVQIPLEALQKLMQFTSYSQWKDRGITHLSDLLHINKIKTFPTLQKEFHLPNSDIFLYIRTKHCIASFKKWTCKIPQTAWIFFRSPAPHQKGISLFYNLLQNKSIFTKSIPLLRWESDLGQSYTVDKREKACKSTYYLLLNPLGISN